MSDESEISLASSSQSSSGSEDAVDLSDSDSEGSETSLIPSFEPSGTDSSSEHSSDDDSDEDRLSDLSWCECSHCTIMASTDCICCREIATILSKVNGLEDSSIFCITEHPGFSSVCLNVWVLQTAYYQYRQEHGVAASPPTLHEKYRYTAYRQLTRWCWGWLGRSVRVVLPACAVNKIRETFPSDTYTGFNFPPLS